MCSTQKVGVIFWDGDGTNADANDAFLKMLGLDYDDALGTSRRDLSPEGVLPSRKVPPH
ncbi:PAS domain-containing protein [Salinigranum halophilum]|uniref:PAS domain-containing protein n=1 Tax=Salinigranum halophilum TaxID=2565931 RepID=UPI00115E7E87